MSNVDRRQTLLGLGLGLGMTAGLTLPATADPVRRLLESLNGPDIMGDLAALRQSRESTRFFADAYLARHPGENNAPRLAAKLMAELESTGGTGAPLPDRLRQRIAQDWDEGRIEKLAGCYMTRTEARLCALAAMAAA